MYLPMCVLDICRWSLEVESVTLEAPDLAPTPGPALYSWVTLVTFLILCAVASSFVKCK